MTERTGVAVAAWLTADEPPPDWKVHEPLSTFLAVDELWLIRDEGDAPDPELWARWKAARRATAGGRRGAQVEDSPIPAVRASARKKAKGA